MYPPPSRFEGVPVISDIVPKLDMSAGITQGNVLGPLIFIFHINDCVKSLNRVLIFMFADDCILYYSGNSWDTVYEILQDDLDRFVNWTL